MYWAELCGMRFPETTPNELKSKGNILANLLYATPGSTYVPINQL